MSKCGYKDDAGCLLPVMLFLLLFTSCTACDKSERNGRYIRDLEREVQSLKNHIDK